jgi:hypothetical protein
MSTFLDRLIEEKKELDGRLERLNTFLHDSNKKPIDGIQIILLNIQEKAMQTYSQVLLERLVLLSEDIPEKVTEFSTPEGDQYEQVSPTLYSKK